jgi:hypothetical protein
MLRLCHGPELGLSFVRSVVYAVLFLVQLWPVRTEFECASCFSSCVSTLIVELGEVAGMAAFYLWEIT